eukprot:4429803-Karenia_brevis.AAC.1
MVTEATAEDKAAQFGLTTPLTLNISRDKVEAKVTEFYKHAIMTCDKEAQAKEEQAKKLEDKKKREDEQLL